MSEFPFGAYADSEQAPSEQEEEASRKPLFLVGGLVGVIVLGASAFLFLGGGDEPTDDFALPVRQPSAAAPPVAEPEAVLAIPAASTDVVGRNPFKARYVEPKAAPAAEAPPATAAPDPAFAPMPLQPGQQPIVIVQQPGGAPARSSAPATAEPQAPAEYPITLKSVEPTGPTGITYTWTIDGKDVAVSDGQRFGRYGELVVLAFEATLEQQPRAVLQVGDATPIRVHIGETVKVL